MKKRAVTRVLACGRYGEDHDQGQRRQRKDLVLYGKGYRISIQTAGLPRQARKARKNRLIFAGLAVCSRLCSLFRRLVAGGLSFAAGAWYHKSITAGRRRIC